MLYAFDPKDVGGTARGCIDTVDFVDGLPGMVIHHVPTIVPQGAPLRISGWVIDEETNGPARAVCLLIDGVRASFPQVGLPRGDVMHAYKTNEFVGFHTVVDTTDLLAGGHEIHGYALDAHDSWHEFGSIVFRVYNHVHAVRTPTDRTVRLDIADPVDMLTDAVLRPGVPIIGDRWARIDGWAIDMESNRGVAGVVVTDERGHSWSGPCDIERQDVQDAFGTLDNRLGIAVQIPAQVLGPGRHRLRLFVIDVAGLPYANSAEVILEVVAAVKPFPLTARQELRPPSFDASMLTIDNVTFNPKGTAKATKRTWPLPRIEPIVVTPRTYISIGGWALDENGHGAEAVLLELSSQRIHVPPYRLYTDCGRHGADGASCGSAPVELAWFQRAFTIPDSLKGPYSLSLVVVQPGRDSYSLVHLASLNVESNTA